MITPILLFFLMAPQQQIEQQLQVQQQQLEQIRRDLQRILDERRQQPASICSVEIRRVGGADQRRVPASVAALVPLNLFSTISRPAESCLPAEIRVTASYLDANDNLICSGVVENIAIQNSLTQSINLEIRPWDYRDFVRWRNEPPERNSGPKRLVCMNPETTAEATSEELGLVSSVRVRATVFPKSGGLSTTEILVNLR